MTIKRMRTYIERRGGSFYRNHFGYWVGEFFTNGFPRRLVVFRADTLFGLHRLVKDAWETGRI